MKKLFIVLSFLLSSCTTTKEYADWRWNTQSIEYCIRGHLYLVSGKLEAHTVVPLFDETGHPMKCKVEKE